MQEKVRNFHPTPLFDYQNPPYEAVERENDPEAKHKFHLQRSLLYSHSPT